MTALLLGLGAAVWLGHTYVAIRIWIGVPRLARLSSEPPRSWPKISFIIPARNEGAELEAALRSKLAVDYPALEWVVVNDRSTDDTGRIVDALANEDSRIVPLHLSELPRGWLGKLYAMERGIERSSGAFFVLSDADVHVAPAALRKVVAWAEQNSIDHVTAVPRVTAPTLLLQATLNAAMRLVLVAFRPWAVSDSTSTASAGIGAFNLVRRSAYDRTPGLSWIKMEVGDDAALGQMLKLSGARSALVNGCEELSLRFYPSLRDAALHLEKASGVGGRLPAAYALVVLFAWCAEMAPFLVVSLPSVPAGARAIAGALCLLALVAAALFARWARVPLRSALLVPLGSTLLAALGLESAALAAWRGGIVWRGTFYSREQLAAGARYQFWPRRGVKPWETVREASPMSQRSR